MKHDELESTSQESRECDPNKLPAWCLSYDAISQTAARAAIID